MSRAEAHRTGAAHRALSVFVFNSLGQILMQRRAPQKDHSGQLWSNTCCTHPRPAENPASAAARRLEEELGIAAELTEIFRFSYTAVVGPGLVEKEYDHVFVGVSDSTPAPNPDEVLDWAWWDIQYLRDRIAATPDSFTPWLRYSLEHVIDRAREEGFLTDMPIVTADATTTDGPGCG